MPARALELCLECISLLLRAGWGGELAPELSGQLLILFTFMAKSSAADSGIATSSEELQSLALKCMGELFTEASRTISGQTQLTAMANIPALGEATLVVLDCLTESSSSHIKLQSVTTLAALVSSIQDNDALASFLPRIVSSLTKVLTPGSNNRAHFRVLERGLDTVCMLFFRLLSDQATKGLPESSPGGSEKSSKVTRSASWLRATVSQIKVALGSIFRVRKHDKPEVHEALFRLCLTIVQECRNSLSDSVSMTIETMICLAGNEGHQRTVENDLRAMLTVDDDLDGILKESLHGWIISLPRLMQSKDDAGRRQVIHQISVALRLLAKDQVVIDDLLAENLRDSVSAVFKDSRSITSISEATASTLFDTQLIPTNIYSARFEPLRFPSKSQEDMMNEFHILLAELAKSHSAIPVALDLVRNLDIGSHESRLANFWICVNLLRETGSSLSLLDEFVDYGGSDPQGELFDSLYSHSLTVLGGQNISTPSHWHSQALALQVFALQATRYKAEFREELNETLYPILYCLGSSNPDLQHHAMVTLNTIAKACLYESASDLVISNVDYIVNAVGLRLSYGDVSPQAPQVLLMMMRLCGPSLLPYLDDLVGSLFGALERFHGYPKLVELLFAVLRGMVEEGVKAPQLAITTLEELSVDDDVKNCIKSNMLKTLREVNELQKKTQEQVEELANIPAGTFPQKPWEELREHPDHSPVPENEEPSEESKVEEIQPPAPRTFVILLRISELTQHYLTSSSPSLRASLLSLLHTTIPALAKHENSFLPLINTLWPVLLPRLEDSEAYIVSNALDIITLMCTHAGNFMRSRIEEAWSTLIKIHERIGRRSADRKAAGRNQNKMTRRSELSSITSMKSIGTTTSDLDVIRPDLYTDTPTRMIWNSLVRVLCAVSSYINIHEVYFADVLELLDPLLDVRDVKKALDKRNPDAVWLKLYTKSKEVAKEKGEAWEFPIDLGGPIKELGRTELDWGFVKL